MKGYLLLVDQVLRGIEKIHRTLRRQTPLNEVPGWTELKGRPLLQATDTQKPWLVVTLFGPTGAGKSTVFRWLTGLEVPAGNARRPMTFNPLVAYPKSLGDAQLLSQLFPSYELHALQDPGTLQERPESRESLYYQAYTPADSDQSLNLILADVPDFDTIYQENWTKAEDMMRRAEMVVFTVYPAAYMDRAVIHNLHRCCRHAGKLVMLFTKAEDLAQIEEIWRDLVEKTASAEVLHPFQEESRQDGRRLCEFLADSEVYFSPYAARPELKEIQPLKTGAPSFLSLLHGLDGVQILLASLREDSRRALDSLRQLIRQAEERQVLLQDQIETADKHLRQAAKLVAGTVSPEARRMQIIMQTAREYRPDWIKRIGRPITWVAGLVSGTVSSLKKVFKQANKGTINPLRELEKKRIGEILEELMDDWRKDLPSAKLTTRRCREARGRLRDSSIPEPGQDWEQTVRVAAGDWAQQHPWRTTVLGSINDLLVGLGGTAAGLDLMVTGGQSSLWSGVILGKLGLIGAAGAGSAGAGALLRFYEELGLRQTVEIADTAWQKQRTKEIHQFLRGKLAEPLFLQDWDREAQDLAKLPLNEYGNAAAGLSDMLEVVRSESQ